TKTSFFPYALDCRIRMSIVSATSKSIFKICCFLKFTSKNLELLRSASFSQRHSIKLFYCSHKRTWSRKTESQKYFILSGEYRLKVMSGKTKDEPKIWESSGKKGGQTIDESATKSGNVED